MSTKDSNIEAFGINGTDVTFAASRGVSLALFKNHSFQIAEDGTREIDLALLLASECGKVDIIIQLLKLGANPNVRFSSNNHQLGITPLMIAKRHLHTDVTRVLLQAGAREDIKDAEGRVANDYVGRFYSMYHKGKNSVKPS